MYIAVMCKDGGALGFKDHCGWRRLAHDPCMERRPMREFDFEPVRMPDSVPALRQEIRELIAAEVEAGAFTPSRNSWNTFDPAFSRKIGERGWIGMSWPREYGGAERLMLER